MKFTYKKIKEMKNEGSNLIKQIPWRMFTVIRKKGGGGAYEIFIVQEQVASLPYHYIYENLFLQ